MLGTWQPLLACVTVGITEVAVMPPLLLESSVRNQVAVGLSSIFFFCLQVLRTYQVYKVYIDIPSSVLLTTCGRGPTLSSKQCPLHRAESIWLHHILDDHVHKSTSEEGR